jgi:hypothetical protein
MTNMSYISNGDFSFPFSWVFYFLKTFYIWSFQNGALNLDGVIRLVSRLPVLMVFRSFENSLIASYFYIALVAMVSIFSFVFFLRRFVGLKSKSFICILSLLIVFNPIFLGNSSKIGLMLGVSMLPAILVFLKEYFSKGAKRSLFLVNCLLVVSLVHPFVFIVNLLCIFLFFAWNLIGRSPKDLKRIIKDLIATAAISLLFNSYLILPLFVLGTFDKTSIVNDVSATAIETNGLLTYANTGGVVNAFSMAKSVLKDFEFYNASYKNAYFFFAFSLYVILIMLYLKKKDELDREDRVFVCIFFVALLFFTALSTGNKFGADKLLNFLISLPAGWSFRSPLKWQFYIPFSVLALLGILLKYIKSIRAGGLMLLSLAVVLLGINLYIFMDVYENLLTPKRVGEFAYLNGFDMENKTLLTIDISSCFSENPSVQTELNQILISKNVQVKSASSKDLNYISPESFDYVFDCGGKNGAGLTFIKKFSKSIFLYKNEKAPAAIYAFDALYNFDKDLDIQGQIDLAKYQLGNKAINFISNDKSTSISYPAWKIGSLFADGNNVLELVKKGFLERGISSNGKTAVYSSKLDAKLQIDNSPISWKKNSDGAYLFYDLEENKTYNFKLVDSRYDYSNVISNGSFEDGSWQASVGDCHSYDKNPQIEMRLDAQEHTDGNQSLELSATRHTACVSTLAFVGAGRNYLLSFDYQSPNSKSAIFYVSFNDSKKSFLKETLSTSKPTWQSYSRILTIPEGATTLRIYVYSNESDRKTRIVNRYDNFRLIEVPDIADTYYVISEPGIHVKNPSSISFDLINPTKKLVHIKGATTPFFLGMSDSYHAKWQLEINNSKIQGPLNRWWPFFKPDKIADSYHYNLNNFLNGWYVDTKDLCELQHLCTQSPDGSYDIEMQIEFWPQRWFYLGLLVSGTTLLGCLGYLGWQGVAAIRRKQETNQ